MQQKAKYKLNDDAWAALDKLDKIEEAVRTLTVTYNELHDSTWERMHKAYFLNADKKYRFNPEAGLIEEV